MHGYRKATIAEVAQWAGVSVTTVSLYLHGKKSVCAPQTGARIDDALKTLHYQPTPMAGAKVDRDQRSIGLLAGTDLERGNPLWVVYNMRFVKGIFQVANAQDFCIINYPFSVSLEHRYRAVLDGRVDGMLFYGSATDPLVAMLGKAGMPTVCFGSPREGIAAVGNVHVDESALVEKALTHLIRLGHTRISHLSGPFEDCPSAWIDEEGERVERFLAEPVSAARRQAFVALATVRGLYRPEYVSAAHAWRGPIVEPEIRRLNSLAEAPTAYLCANDYIARAALAELSRLGVPVPKAVSLIGIDNIDGTHDEGRLTSVDIPVEEIGRQAMDAMLDYLLNGDAALAQRTVAPGPLVVRSTTGPAPTLGPWPGIRA